MKTRRRIVASFVIVITLLGLLASGNAWPIEAQGPGITERVSVAPNGTQGNLWSAGPSISADGRYVAFRSYASNLVSGDSNGRIDVFVHDRQTDQTIRVSVASDGTQGNEESYTPWISTNGRYIAFGSRASNLVSNDTNGVSDAFINDRLTGQTTVSSQYLGVRAGPPQRGPAGAPAQAGNRKGLPLLFEKIHGKDEQK